MDFWTNIIIFLVILFFYMHLQHQYKKSEDLEIYEMDYLSNTNLQEIVDMKQPVFFSLENTDSLFSKLHPALKEEVIVKDVRDYSNSNSDSDSIDGIALSFSSAYGLMNSDPKSTFFSEKNDAFLSDSEFIKTFASFSKKIGTGWSVHTAYDLLFGSPNVELPWKFHTASQRFLVTSPGEGVRIKMTPWKSRKYLDVIYDTENNDLWARDSTSSGEIKLLDFELKPGFVLYIPPYWFYRIQFSHTSTSTDANSKISFLASFTYATPMNILANIQQYVQPLLQSQTFVFSKKKIQSNSVINEKEEVETEVQIEKEKEVEKKDIVQEMISVIEKPKQSLEEEMIHA